MEREHGRAGGSCGGDLGEQGIDLIIASVIIGKIGATSTWQGRLASTMARTSSSRASASAYRARAQHGWSHRSK